jgi:signal peptidase I
MRRNIVGKSKNSREYIGEELQIKLIFKLFLLWFLCLIALTGAMFFAANQFGATTGDKAVSGPSVFGFMFFAAFLLGTAAFFSAIHKLNKQLIKLLGQKLPFPARYLISIVILPILLFLYILIQLKKLFSLKLRTRSHILRIFGLGLIFSIISPIWLGGYFIAVILGANQLGYIDHPISIAGTGSMYPTFPKGQTKTPEEQGEEVVATQGMFPYPSGLVIFGKRFFGHEIGRGDIVVVENNKIREWTQALTGNPSGWVKRVIGISRDTIELRNGIVYLNNERLKEQYIARPRSTFGQMFLKDCTRVTVPQGSVFIMGDNRRGSGDSREIGFVALGDIKYVLPLNAQKGSLDKAWRDTSRDFDEASKIKLNKEKYLELLNEKRKEAGAKQLKYQPKLEKSAFKRGEVILKFDDFSFEATRSGYTMTKAMRDANYSNIVYGESLTQGYYDAEELINNQFQFPESKKFLTEKNYQDIGIAEVEGEINGCPAQVIVQHFAGYVPPNYSKQEIDAWKSNLSRLREIQPGWAEVKNWGGFYERNKKDVDRINEIISIRIANISAIVEKMERNQWLSQRELDYANQDQSLHNEQVEIADRLNSQ